jgi:hypothetical protein
VCPRQRACGGRRGPPAATGVRVFPLSGRACAARSPPRRPCRHASPAADAQPPLVSAPPSRSAVWQRMPLPSATPAPSPP